MTATAVAGSSTASCASFSRVSSRWRGIHDDAITGAGDFSGDGIGGDVLARGTDGLLFLYPANGTGGWKSGSIHVGTGWSQFDAITGAGDFDGS